MSGPSTTRADVSTAPIESLGGPLEQLLSQFANQASQGQSTAGSQFAAQPNALQGQLGNVFANLLAQPSAQQKTLEASQGILQGLGQNAGQQVVDAAQPIFQQNLQQGADILRQSGPRFGSNTERLVGEQNQQSLQDFNLFQQQALQQGQQTQLGALDLLGRLSGGADAFRSGVAGQAGGFALGQQQNQQAGLNTQANIFSQLLQQLFQAGGGGSAPVIQQNPGTLGAILGTAGTIGGAAISRLGNSSDSPEPS